MLGGLAACALVGCASEGAREGDAMAYWIRNAGKIYPKGDSLTEGYHGLLGGWRPGLSAALTAAGVAHSYVGQLSDAYGAHHGVPGISAFQQGGSTQTDCETYDPRIIILGYGTNDVGGLAAGGQARTAAQCVASLTNVINWCQAGAPQALIFMQTLIVPQNAGIPSYYDRREIFEEANSLFPALVLAEGIRLIDVGAPETSDGLHPTQTGYTATMAPAIASAVLAAVPGAI